MRLFENLMGPKIRKGPLTLYKVSMLPKTFHPKTSLYLYLFILMDYPLHIDTISIELFILYFKRLSVKISLK